MSSAGREAVELAAAAGLDLDPWQAHVLDVALGERPDGRWAAREVGLVCPRQNGKGSVLEALELAALFLFDDCQLILHSSHEFKTSAEAYLRVKGLIQNTPELHRLVGRYYNSHGAEGIELKNGRRLRFVARTGGSGRGFTGNLVILDEAFNLSPAAMSALAFTVSAVDNPQIWYTSSAPLPVELSGVLRSLCRRGREGDDGLAYFEFTAGDGDDLDDPATWAKANPGYPHRIGAETILTERRMVAEEDFARERCGLWVDIDTEIAQVIPGEAWAACMSDDSDVSGQPAFALEVAEDRSWAAFAAAGASTAGEFIHAEVTDYKPGTDWVVERAIALHDKWGGKLAVAKSSPAGSLVESLRVAGVDVVEVPVEDHARFCGQLFDAVVQGRFRHRDQPHLDVAVRCAVRRDVGDAWVWSRKKSKMDISPLVAVTLAAGLHAQPSVPAPRPFALRL